MYEINAVHDFVGPKRVETLREARARCKQIADTETGEQARGEIEVYEVSDQGDQLVLVFNSYSRTFTFDLAAGRRTR